MGGHLLKRLTERGRRWGEEETPSTNVVWKREVKKRGRLGRSEQLARDKKHGREGKTTSYYSN